MFITHDLSLANHISERAVILYRGEVVERGATEKIFSNPLHPYTQRLISSVPRLDKKWDVKADLQAASALAGELGYGAQIQTNLPAGASQPARPNVPALIEAEPDHFVAA